MELTEKVLFPCIDKNDTSIQGFAEPFYDFLNRSNWTVAKNARDLLICWLSEIKDISKVKSLIGNLIKGDDEQFLSHYFEIFLHAFLMRIGYDVCVEPLINDTKPDFLIKDENNNHAYFEAIQKTEDKTDTSKNNNKFIDALNRSEKLNHTVSIIIKNDLQSDRYFKKYTEEIIIWIDNEVDKFKQTKPSLIQSTQKTFAFNGGEIEIKISDIKKFIDTGQQSKSAGLYSYGFKLCSTLDLIRKAIIDKGKKIGKIDKHFIIAINLRSLSCDREDLFDAFYGDEGLLLQNDLNPENCQHIRQNGLLQDRVHKFLYNLLGVIVFPSVTPFNVNNLVVMYFPNPICAPKPTTKFEIIGSPNYLNNNTYPIFSINTKQLLSLPENWPEDL